MRKIGLLLLFLAPVLLWGEIEQSYELMPFSNGIGSAAYQLEEGKAQLMYFYDHIYQNYDEDTSSASYSRKGAYWGIRSGTDIWLNDVAPFSSGYVDGTGIVKVEKELDDLIITEYFFMPMDSDYRIVCSIMEISNTGNREGVTPFFYGDFGMGGGAKSKYETAEYNDGVFIEGRDADQEGMNMVVYPYDFQQAAFIPKASFVDEVKEFPVPLFDDVVSNGSSVIEYVQFKGQVLEAGESMKVMIVLGLSDRGDEDEYTTVVKELGELGPDALLQKEIDAWEAWHSFETIPAGLSEDQLRLFRQSTAVLKMGQCREPGETYGQILASMPPGMWNIAWVRDGAYSLVALAQSGHYDEAKAGLEFMLNGPGGEYTDYVGRDYLLSVCRYWGNGEEESDWNPQGPNIEWDNFGLFLWAFSEYIELSGDTDFRNDYYDLVKDGVADVLISLINEEGYLVPDSSIWERHWEPAIAPDGKESFSYSTINAINGLTLLAGVSANTADKNELLEYAGVMESGFLANFIVDDVVIQSIEEKERGIDYFMDASSVEAINFDIVDDTVAEATLDAFEEYLGMDNSTGFRRNDDWKDYDYSWYDEQEWIVIDLRIAHAYHKIGNTDRADEIMDWIEENAFANSYLIPELYEQNDMSYEGAIPMCGFGAGAYIINLYSME